MNGLHPLDEALSLKEISVGIFAGQTHPGFQNMVGPFGGVTAAAFMKAALRHPECLGDPLALTVNYASPISQGFYEIEANPAKTNRSTQHWIMTMRQEGQVVATATAVTAKRRPTWSAHDAKLPLNVPSPESLPRMDLTGRSEWLHRYDIRVVEGNTGIWDQKIEEHSENTIWIADDPKRPIDFLSLTGLCDVFFPRIFLRRRTRVPIGTVSMTIYYHADAQSFARHGDDFVLGVARANRFSNGFYDQLAEVWGRDGELLASTHQIVYYKE